MARCADRRVLVTGSARRIGRDIALWLGREGARVLIHYNESERDARDTNAACGAEGLLQANLESVPEITRMFAEIGQRFGPLYGLLNNTARFTRFHPFDVTEADWDFIHQ